MFSIILSDNNIDQTLKYIDSILSTLSGNPELLSIINKAFWAVVIIILVYTTFKTIIFLYKRIDKKRCDKCMERSLTTIIKFEALVSEYFKNHKS